jgi:predicted ATPase
MVQVAEELAQPYGVTLAQYFAAQIQRYCRNVQATHTHVEAAFARATDYGFVHWAARILPLSGWVLAHQGQWDEARNQLDQGLAAMADTGSVLGRPWALLLFADVCRMTGKVADGLTALTEALACIEDTGERYYEAELHRLQGELLLQQASPDGRQAEQCFQNALHIAHGQQAKSLELRVAMSLSRLWWQEGKSQEARGLLAPVYHGFTEGFDTADLKEAKVFLDQLED